MTSLLFRSVLRAEIECTRSAHDVTGDLTMAGVSIPNSYCSVYMCLLVQHEQPHLLLEFLEQLLDLLRLWGELVEVLLSSLAVK
jgi:hypothetical protein